MSFVEVPIDCSSCLGAAAALAVVKLKRVDAVSTSYAFESDAAVHRLGRVIAHNFHSNLSEGHPREQEVLALRVERVALI
jgi:hypothetical protein